MNRRILRKPRAIRDLTECYAFIARDKLARADHFLQVAEQVFEFLAEEPKAGRVWETSEPQLGEIRVYPMASPFRSYLVFYRFDATAVEIMAVIHGARNRKGMISEKE